MFVTISDTCSSTVKPNLQFEHFTLAPRFNYKG